MEKPEHYEADVLHFFDGKDLEREIYEALFARMDAAFPDGRVQVQKSQISFYGRHLFGAASLPVRRRRGWPERCLVATVGLARQLESPRVAVAVEPYPGRWTHHILLTEPSQADDELMDWMREAYAFAEAKRRGKRG